VLAKNQITNYISIDSNPFNSIQLNEPTVVIRNATISPGISATSYLQIEKLQELLISRKNDIDDLLKLQPVYAIGIDFHNDSISPCISCWVAKPLDNSILECLEAMFENQFEAIYQISIPDKTSDAIVITADQKNYQKFTIATDLRAKFSPLDLEYEINVYQCTTGKMLSKDLPFFQRRGHGYFLDSVEVCVSPIPYILNTTNNLFMKLGTSYPQQLNRTVEISNCRERSFEGKIGGPNISAKCGIKSFTDTKYTSNEWTLNYCSDHTTGDIWSYRYADNLENERNCRTSYYPGYHSAKWETKETMKGFCITITQVVRYRISIWDKVIPQKPEFITCPVIAHNLKISFNNFKDFNTNFAKIARFNRAK
ncbi:4589_t:CDS:2, partial [Funneliformis mosseae]